MVLMEKIEKFLDRGKLIHPTLYEKIENLEEGEIEKLLESNSLVLSKEDLKRINIPQPKIITQEKEEEEHVHVSDFTQFYLERFNFLKEEIEDKMERESISSINKLSSGEAAVIGMVREASEEEVVLEDNTGRILLETEERFLEDEVVGAKGDVIVNEEVRMRPQKIVYPDVPLGKEVNKTEEDLSALFLSEIDKRSQEVVEDRSPEYLFLSKKMEEEKSVNIPTVGISDSSWESGNLKTGEDPVQVRLGNLRILVHDGSVVKKAKEKLNVDQTKALISLLQKRHLNPSQMHSLEDRYLLEEVPDIIHVNGEEGMANYKGVTLLSTSPEKGYEVNLKTREVEEIDLS